MTEPATSSQVFIILKGSIKLGARERVDGRTVQRLLCPFYGALKTHSKARSSALGHPLMPDYAHPRHQRGVSICRPHLLTSGETQHCPDRDIPRDTSKLFIASSRVHRPSVRRSDFAKKGAICHCWLPLSLSASGSASLPPGRPAPTRPPSSSPPLLSQWP